MLNVALWLHFRAFCRPFLGSLWAIGFRYAVILLDALKKIHAGYGKLTDNPGKMDKGNEGLIQEERRRIGKILHDGICQELTVMTFLAYELEQKLAAKSLTEAAEAAKLLTAIQKAIAEIQKLMKDLSPHA